MNAPMFRRICAHSGSSFGSKTTHLRAAKQALFEEEREAVAQGCISTRCLPRRHRRACGRPSDIARRSGRFAKQFRPSGLSAPFSASVSL